MPYAIFQLLSANIYATGGSIDLELESGVCYFNNVAYPMGHFVCSGDEILKCCERGVWVRMGSVHVSAIR